MSARAAAAYKKVYLESATPTRVLDELFERLQRDMREARRLIEAGDRAGKGHQLDHALAIVGELIAALDFEQAPELCTNLRRLYDYVNDRLVEANLRIETAPLDRAEQVVQTLREAFQSAAEKAPSP